MYHTYKTYNNMSTRNILYVLNAAGSKNLLFYIQVVELLMNRHMTKLQHLIIKLRL